MTDTGGAVARRWDYLPFGGLIKADDWGRSAEYSANVYPATPVTEHLLFTGKSRDAETELDCFGPRYFSAPRGRFTGADAALADLTAGDAQRWNLHGCVGNTWGAPAQTGELSRGRAPA